MSYAVKAEKLEKVYSSQAEEIVALKRINLTIKQGEFVSIIGPSAAGKTTLLNLIGCLDTPNSGELEVLGNYPAKLSERNLSRLRMLNIGFIFEEFFLISSLNALENVQLPLIFANNFKNNSRPKELLERVGLTQRMRHLPGQLSDGEMQRVAVARALANKPQILLADEPTGNLDTKNAQGLFDLFSQLNKNDNLTILVATHNIKLGYSAKRVVHLRDGNIEKDQRL